MMMRGICGQCGPFLEYRFLNIGVCHSERIYRLKDFIEKSFGNLKERLFMRWMFVTSEKTVNEYYSVA